MQGDSPFGDSYVISVGFVIILCLTIPMGYFNLDDNIWVQKGAFIMLILCLLTWTGQFIGLGLDADNMPAVAGGGFNQLGVLVSNTLLNYAFVVTVRAPCTPAVSYCDNLRRFPAGSTKRKTS